MSIEFWTMPLAPPAMSPRIMSPACSTMSEAFSTALVAMSRAASTASLGLKPIGISFCRRTFGMTLVVHQGAPVLFGNLATGPQYPGQPDGHRDAEQPQPQPRQRDDPPQHGGHGRPRRQHGG